MDDLSIGEIVARTGVAEGTLRMWERRHGFPAPARLASGHRRYRESDVEAIRRIAAERAGGSTLAVAIERARRPADRPRSLFAWLRRAHPQLEPQLLSKPVLLALSHAIEDESLSRAEHPLLFASFQRERFYRQAEPRWREFSRGAGLACVFADFQRPRRPAGGPAEIPLEEHERLLREWAIVCDAPSHAACLVGWEVPPDAPGAGRGRTFETLWSVEPRIVRDAARICAGLARADLEGPIAAQQGRLDAPASQPMEEQLRLAAAVTNRALSYLPDGGGRHA